MCRLYSLLFYLLVSVGINSSPCSVVVRALYRRGWMRIYKAFLGILEYISLKNKLLYEFSCSFTLLDLRESLWTLDGQCCCGNRRRRWRRRLREYVRGKAFENRRCRKTDRQCTCNVIFRHVGATVVVVHSSECYIFCVCVCSLSHPACKAHAPYCRLWPAWFYHTYPHFLIHNTIFETKKKVTEHKTCLFIFSKTFVWNISHS